MILNQETKEAVKENPQIEGPEINQSEKISPIQDTKMTEIEEENNFLDNIFSTEETNIWKPADKIPLVKNEIENIKIKLKTFLESSDFDIDSILNESQELCHESDQLIEEMIACKEEVEQNTIADILKSFENLDIAEKELDRVNFAIKIVSYVVSCNRLLKEFEESKKIPSLSRGVDAIGTILEMIEIPPEGWVHTSMYNTIKTTAFAIWENLLLDLLSKWHQLVSWNCEETESSTKITINIKIDDTCDDILEFIRAFNISKHLRTQIGEFGKFLLNDIVVPIIHKDSTVVVETDEIIHVNIKKKIGPKPPYEKVLCNLKILLTAINNKFKYNAKIFESLTQMLGTAIAAEFSDILKNECLINTIPYSLTDLQNYQETIKEIEEFQNFLFDIHFFGNQTFNIMAYMKDIDALFAVKSSQYYLSTAREIMLKDLSVSMSIGVETITAEESKDVELPEEDRQALKVFDRVIGNSLFYFPRCMISRTTQELLDLLYAMMEQAAHCQDVVAKRLYVTARLIFELYDAVVPYHHENFLNNIPQYVALFHNNCMYLAHNLQTLGDKWQTHLDGREVDYPISFLDLVPKLRELGCKHLAIHMQQQRKQILDNIRSSDLNCIVVKDVLGDNAEQAIRQCLRQLQLLKNVWIGVFPVNVFTNLISTLANMFLEELIHRVCTVEDISAEMATQLTDIYSLVVKKAPNLFQNSEDIENKVPSWVKLQELILVLSGSLKDIEKRWQDGTGPLAIHFRVEEIRSLIKALFQNTQFRANLLSKIK